VSSAGWSAPGEEGAPALAVERLTKRFGDRAAFQDVSFEVGYGEVFGFLGPNGAGKTTTVRTLGTLIAPTSGSATVAGVPLTPENAVEIRRRIAVMPESPGLYLRLSVAENLECFAGLYESSVPRERIDDALRAVNLADRAHDACFGIFVAAIELFAQPAVASAVLRGPELLGQLLFTPLVAAASIWVGIAISARSNDPRVAAQLSVLASLPTIVVTTVIAVGGIEATPGLVLILGAGLLLLDGLGWRIVSPMFDRERLITGTRS